jgi:hypothetical protein
MSRRRKKKTLIQGTITPHHGFWCLRFRERVRVGDTIKTVQRSKRLAPIDEDHKTRKSVEPLAELALEPVHKVPPHYLAIQLRDFMEGKYLPFIESKRKPSTLRGYKQMWLRYLKPRCANLVMHTAETRMIQQVLDDVEKEEKLAPQSLAHVKHLLGGAFRFAIKQGYLPRGTGNPVSCTETSVIPDFNGRAYSLEEVALMLSVLSEPARTIVACCNFHRLEGR